MFNLLPLRNNSVIIGLSFLLLIISAIVSSNIIHILRFFSRLCFSIFLELSCISFEYSKKALRSLECFKSVLSHLLLKY